MTNNVHQQETELHGLLSQLARFFKVNETNLSAKNCEYCLGRLPDDDRSALETLFRMLQRKRKNTSSSSCEQRYEDQRYEDQRYEDQRYEAQRYEDQNPPSDHRCNSPNQTAQDTSHWKTPESDAEITSDSSDSGEDDLDDEDALLRDTNFSRCSMKPPSSVNDVLSQCIKSPHHFFTAVTQVSVPSKGGFPDAFCRVYKSQQRDDILRIHRRFDLHNLYALAVKLGYHTGKKWKWGALKKVPGDILSNHPSLGLQESKIKEHLMHYVRIGRGYGKWVEYFGDPGYLIALPLGVTETEYTENRYAKCIPVAARKMRELGIDDVVKEFGLSKLGKYIARRLSLRFNPLVAKTGRVMKRKMMSKKPPSATNDERDSSTSTLLVNADQTQRAQDEPNQKRRQLEDENLPFSAPSGTSVFTARNANLATNIRFVDALQTPLNDEPNHHSVSHIGISSMGVLPGQTSDDQDPQSFQAPPQPAAGDNPYFGRHKPDDQGYAQAFFQPSQPIAEAHFNDQGLEDQNCAQAFFQPIQPIAEAHFNDHGLEDQNCAQAFFQPIQPIAEAPFDNRGPNDQNCAQTFPQPFSPTGSNSASEYPAASTSDFLSTADFLYHRLGHPCSLRSDELPPTTNLINHQNVTGDIHQPSQHISGRSVDHHNIATSVDAGPSQYIAVTPTPTAVVAA